MSVFVQDHAGHLIMLGGPLLILAAMLLVLHLTGPDRPPRPARPARQSAGIITLAALWVLAAGVHMWVTPEHFRESLLFGVFFLGLAAVQIGYGMRLLRRPDRRLLVAGIATNVSIISLWVWSRLAPLPFGLDTREPVGALDVLSTTVEAISTAVALWLVYRRTVPGQRPAPTHREQDQAACDRPLLPAR